MQEYCQDLKYYSCSLKICCRPCSRFQPQPRSFCWCDTISL